MDVACTEQAREAKVAFRNVTGKGMWGKFRVPKRSSYTVNEVFNLMEGLRLNQIKMVPPGVITPWRFGCRIAHFGGDILQAMKTLSADARDFYHKELSPDSRSISIYHPPGPEKNAYQQNPR